MPFTSCIDDVSASIEDELIIPEFRFKAVVFDLDGVVAKTAEVHFHAWKEIFDEFLQKHHSEQKPFEKEDYLKYVDGVPRTVGAHNFLKSRDIEIPTGTDADSANTISINGIGKKKDDRFLKLLNEKGAEVFHSTITFIKQLKEKGIKTAIASSSRNCQLVLRKTGTEYLFDVRVDGIVLKALGLQGKPNPDIFLTCCKLLGVSAEESVVVEDAVQGVQAGQAGGFGLVLGIDRAKGQNRTPLLEGGATIVVEDLAQLSIELLHDLFPHASSGWTLAFNDFYNDREKLREALCTLGNGYYATRGAQNELRAVHDPEYHHYPATYIAGCYNVSKTKLHGHMVTSDDIVNMPNWLHVSFRKEGTEWFDWTKVPEKFAVEQFHQQLNVMDGTLLRRFRVRNLETGDLTSIISQRVVHMKNCHLGMIKYIIIPENWSGKLQFISSLDGDVQNKGVARYKDLNGQHLRVVSMGPITGTDAEETNVGVSSDGEVDDEEAPKESSDMKHHKKPVDKTKPIYQHIAQAQCSPIEEETPFDRTKKEGIYLLASTLRSRIDIAMASRSRLHFPGCGRKLIEHDCLVSHKENIISEIFGVDLVPGDVVVAEKIVSIHTSKDRGISTPEEAAFADLERIKHMNFAALLKSHQLAWRSMWNRAYLEIKLEQPPFPSPCVHNESRVSGDASSPLSHSIELSQPFLTELYNQVISYELGTPTKGNYPNLVVDHNKLMDTFEKEGPNLDSIDLQFILRFHSFHLIQTLCKNTVDMDVSVPARGLHGESYRGHIFWDEIFIFPCLNSKVPELSRSLLLYRYYRLPAAKDKARKFGGDGALFSWQSASSGNEETPDVHYNPISKKWYPDLSQLQLHVNIAVFFSYWQYFEVTGDMSFMELYGAELLIEICRFWASIANYNTVTGRFEIKGVMGPDEFHEAYPESTKGGLNNNAYTNVMVAVSFMCVLQLMDLLPVMRRREIEAQMNITPDELALWDKMSRRMTVVFDEDYIISQFEGFDQLKELDWKLYKQKYGNIQRLDRILGAEGDSTNNYQVCKQADVCMIFYLLSVENTMTIFHRLGYPFNKEIMKRNIEYYLARTSHGSTLSQAVYASVLYKFDKERAWKLYTEFILADICDIQKGTTGEGIHTVAMATSLNMVMREFCGVDTTKRKIEFNPSLPDGITSMSFNLQYTHQWMRVDLNRDRLKVTPFKGLTERVDIVVQKHHVQPLVPNSSAEFVLDDDTATTTTKKHEIKRVHSSTSTELDSTVLNSVLNSNRLAR